MIIHVLIHTHNRFIVRLQNNHAYVLNHDWCALHRTQYDEGERKRACASADFHIKKEKHEDDEHYKMIDCSNDILQIIEDHGKVKKREEPIYNLVLRDDNLNIFVFIRIPRICI